MHMTETKEHALISYLESRRDDRAMLAALRRGLGTAPGGAAEMFPYIVPFVQRWNEDDIYMIAALFALHPASAKRGNMGAHLRALAREVGDDEATERRFVQLLRMRRDTLEPRLRQQISILKSKDIPVNWHQLIRDVGHWDHPEHFVQRNWARSFWGAGQAESKSE